MKTKEQIIAELKKDKDFAECSAEELEVMAEMELKSQANRHYEQSDTPRKKADRPKKVDEVKKSLIATLSTALNEVAEEVVVRNDEKYIDFQIGADHYTLNLVKHRSK